MKRGKLHALCRAAVIGALYAAVTLLAAPISFGNLQCRVSEALCILPWFFPETAWGLFVGCILANLLGAAGPWTSCSAPWPPCSPAFSPPG